MLAGADLSCVGARGAAAKQLQFHAQALLALGCMEHRGACSADSISGDGAGIMTGVPWDMFKSELPDVELNEKTTGSAFTSKTMSSFCTEPDSSLMLVAGCKVDAAVC